MKSRMELEAIFQRCRNNLLIVVLLTLANVVLTQLDGDYSFLFSATLPVMAVGFGKVFAEELGNIFLIMGSVAGFLGVAAYAACYWLSKKYKSVFVVALVFFSLDSLGLLWLLSMSLDWSMLLDIAFHAWILFYLITSVNAWTQWKKLPADEYSTEIPFNGQGPVQS